MIQPSGKGVWCTLNLTWVVRYIEIHLLHYTTYFTSPPGINTQYQREANAFTNRATPVASFIVFILLYSYHYNYDYPLSTYLYIII